MVFSMNEFVFLTEMYNLSYTLQRIELCKVADFFFAVIARHCRRLDWWTTTLSTYIRLYSKVSSKKLFANKVRITLVRISFVKFDKSNIVACSFAHFCREASSSKSIFFHYKANTVSPDSYIYIYLPTYLPTSFAWR